MVVDAAGIEECSRALNRRGFQDHSVDDFALKKAKAALPVVIIVLLFVVMRPLGRAMPDTIVRMDPEESDVKVGQIFTVNVSITDVSELVGVDFLLAYNATILQLVNVDQGPFMQAVGPTFMVNLTKEGMVWLAVVILDPQGHMPSASGSGVLATVTFKAIAPGESSLDLYSKDPYKPDEVKLASDPADGATAIPNVAIDGRVVVSPDPPDVTKPPIVGDVNGDGKVDMQDVGVVASVFQLRSTNPRWNPKCDFNSDGIVDMKDIGIVGRHFGEHN
jgi:hypothetical protein